MEKVEASILGTIYRNDDNGYTVLTAREGRREITVVGTLPYVVAGDTLTLYGKWVHNPKYGRQFKVEQSEKQLPADRASILRYLSSGTVNR